MSILFLSLTILLEKQEKATAADFDGGGVICRNPNCLSFSFLFVLNAEINRNRDSGTGGEKGAIAPLGFGYRPHRTDKGNSLLYLIIKIIRISLFWDKRSIF